MIALTINVTEQEWAEAQAFCKRSSRGTRIRQRVYLAVMCLLSILGILSIARTTPPGSDLFLALLTPAYLLLGVLIASFKRTVFKGYELAAVTLNGIEAEIDEAGYRWHREGWTNGIVYWQAFTGWMETPNTFVLIRGALLYILQKSALSPEASQELRELCLRSLGAARA